jgi:hypothetical protein
MVTNSQEIVEKAHLTFLTPLSGVIPAFLGNRSPIVERMVKPLFFAFHKETCSRTFSTDSDVRYRRRRGLVPNKEQKSSLEQQKKWGEIMGLRNLRKRNRAASRSWRVVNLTGCLNLSNSPSDHAGG